MTIGSEGGEAGQSRGSRPWWSISLLAISGLALATSLASRAQSTQLDQASPSAAAKPADPPPPLVAGPGHDTYVRVCSVCHQAGIRPAKRRTRDLWAATMQRMKDQHGAAFSDQEGREILNYLAKNYTPTN